MLTVTLILLLAAFVCAVASAMGKVPAVGGGGVPVHLGTVAGAAPVTRNDVVMSLVLGLIVVAVVVATIMLPPNVTTAPPRPSDVISGTPVWADTSNDSTERTAP